MPPTNEAINNVWGSSVVTGATEFLTLPSGQTVYAKRIGLEALVQAGLLGEADSLVGFVDRKHINKPDSGITAEDLSAVMSNPGALQSLIMLCDRAMPLIVTEPSIMLHLLDMPNGSTQMIPPNKREAGVIYTDQVPLQDKIFLLNFGIKGLADLERFREQSETAVAAMGNGPGVPHDTRRTVGNRQARRRR
jgi:hypothetical protein